MAGRGAWVQRFLYSFCSNQKGPREKGDSGRHPALVLRPQCLRAPVDTAFRGGDLLRDPADLPQEGRFLAAGQDPALPVRRRHDDDGVDTEVTGGHRHPLRVVARRGGNHPSIFLVFSQVGQLVVCTTQFERKNRLMILSFQENAVFKACRKGRSII